jgi:hypothetical protein
MERSPQSTLIHHWVRDFECHMLSWNLDVAHYHGLGCGRAQAHPCGPGALSRWWCMCRPVLYPGECPWVCVAGCIAPFGEPWINTTTAPPGCSRPFDKLGRYYRLWNLVLQWFYASRLFLWLWLWINLYDVLLCNAEALVVQWLVYRLIEAHGGIFGLVFRHLPLKLNWSIILLLQELIMRAADMISQILAP